MIEKYITLEIIENKAKLSDNIYLYEGDGDITINFIIKGMGYVFTKMYYDFILINPLNINIISGGERKELINNTAILYITKDMINDIGEIGEYQLQIRVWDDEIEGNRIALPSIYFTVNNELKGDITVLRLATTEDNKVILTEDGKILLL